MIKQSKFNKEVTRFPKIENRAAFFALASKLMNLGFETEAYILILATWNFARFRYAVREFNVEAFKKTLGGLSKQYIAISNENIKSIDINAHKKTIRKVFGTLAKIKGVEYTGASKLMHLKNPKLFVMWDDYIRGDKPKKYYKKLEIVQKGDWLYDKYPRSADGYIRFLKDMQCRFGHLRSPSQSKPLAKAIDEFNYVCITQPIQRMMND